MLQTLESLERTLQNPTDEQTGIIINLKNQIEENGRFYEVTALTVELMRDHGYDVTEEDAGYINAIAEKIEVDEDMLWMAVEVWADYYGLKRIDYDE